MSRARTAFLESNIYPEYVVMEFPFDEESFVNITDMMQQLKPYFEEMGIEHISMHNDPYEVIMNVPYESVDGVKDLFLKYGLEEWTETTGDEDRQAKNDGRLDGGMAQGRQNGTGGWWSGYVPTRLIGEMPGQG